MTDFELTEGPAPQNEKIETVACSSLLAPLVSMGAALSQEKTQPDSPPSPKIEDLSPVLSDKPSLIVPVTETEIPIEPEEQR